MNFLFALLAAVTPLYTTHNNVPGNTPTMTNMQAWAESIGGAGMSSNQVVSIASSPSVTNEGAVASAKAYSDGTFLPIDGSKPMRGRLNLSLSREITYGPSGRFVYYPKFNMFAFEGVMQNISSIIPDGTQVATHCSISNVFPIVTNSYTKGEVNTSLANKADLAVPSAAGNFAALTSSGNLADSGCSTNSFAPAVDGGYLPLNGGKMNGDLEMGQNVIFFVDYRYWIGVESVYDNTIVFGDDDTGLRSHVYPDGTPVMTEGQADFHIVSNAPVTSGQIGNFNITNLTAKTISCSVSTASGKASDILIWTWGNTAECQMTFTLPSGFTLVGDAADTKATANKKCLFSLVKISNTEVIVSKKEY